MRKLIDSALKALSEFWKKLGKREKIRLIILAAVIIILAIVVAVVLGRTTYAVLYTNLDAATAGDVIAELDGLGVTYKTEGVGTILVPEEQVSQVKMQIASLGYFSGGFDYDLFADSSGFGVTDFQLRKQDLQLTEYKVRQQLLTLSKIYDCLVQIYLPETSSFVLSKNDEEQASASVTLKLKSGMTLDQSEVNAIAYVVAGGTNIPVENVIIVDDAARHYTMGEEDSFGSGNLSSQLELEKQARTELESTVISLLSPVFGSGKVKASVGLTLNFDDESVQSIELSPPVDGSEEGIVISMEELYEYTRDSTAGGVVGTDSNGIGTPEYPYGSDEGYDYRYIAKTVNYEVDQIITEIQKAKGTIKSLSIAVLIDSEAIDEDYTEIVRDLVVNAIGVNSNYVSVARLPFQGDSEFDIAKAEQDKAARQNQILEIVKLILQASIVVLLILAVFYFLRTILKAVLPEKEPEPVPTDGPASGEAGDLIDYIASDAELRESLDDIELSSKNDVVEQLGKIIDKDSKAIAQLLRNWLTDEE